MSKSSRRRSRRHDREERGGSDSDEAPRPREQEDMNGSVRDSKGLGQHEKRISLGSSKLHNAGDASGSSVEGRKKRGRGEQEALSGDDRWSGGGEDDKPSYHDSKKLRNSDSDAKGKTIRKMEESKEESDRHNEIGRRNSGKGTLSVEYSVSEHHQLKERTRDIGKLKASKQVLTLKEDNINEQYRVVTGRSIDHGSEKGNEGKSDVSSKVMIRMKDLKMQDLEGDRVRNKYNGTNERQLQDEFPDGDLEKNGMHRKTRDHSDQKADSRSDSRDMQTMPRDMNTKIDGRHEHQHGDKKFKIEISRGAEKTKEEKYKEVRSKFQDKYKNNKYKDDRHREEEKYKEERSRDGDRHGDRKYKEDISKEDGRHKDLRYREKPRDEEKPRTERPDNTSREKYRDDVHRNHRHQDGRSRDVRSSKGSTRDTSSEKQYKEEHNYSESRHKKNRLHNSEDDTSAADHRTSKHRDDNKGKERSYGETIDYGDLESRSAKEYHLDATKRRSEVDSFVSSLDRRREYEKVDSRRRDHERKNPTSHFPKQVGSPAREYGTAIGRHRRTSDFESVEGQSKIDANINIISPASKDGRSLRSDSRPIQLNDRPPSVSDWQVPFRSNLRQSHDTVDGLMKKAGRHHDSLNCQLAENYQTASLGNLHLVPDRSEIDTRRSFDDDYMSQIREHRSGSRPRRSGIVDNARGHGNTWNNPSAWPSPVPNGFGLVQHGPPPAGFHPAIHQFPQSLFAMRPSMDMNYTGVPYPLHGHPGNISHLAQPFPWHNPSEDPYLSRFPDWEANRNVFKENSHSYDRDELGRNRDPHFQQQSDVPFSSHTCDKPSSMQFPGQNQSQQSNTQSSEIRTVGETSEKIDAPAPKYTSETKHDPSNIEVDPFCSNYFKILDLSTNLASSELYKKCITMVREFDPSGSCKLTMRQCLKNNKYENGCQVKGSKHMISSIFSGEKTSIFQRAMSNYSSATGSMKSKTPTSFSQPESEEVIEQASENMVEDGDVTVTEDLALPRTCMCDEVHNNDQPCHADPGLVKDCSNREEKVKDESPTTSHGEGHASYNEEQQVPSNGQGELPHDAKTLQPCYNSIGNIIVAPKDEFSGVISDTAFASHACQDTPDCRANLYRIPCSPGST